MLKKFSALCLLALLVAACSSKPPAKEQVQQAIKKFVPMNFDIMEVSEMKGMPGLYEVVIGVNKVPVVLYVDKDVKYVFSGSVMEVDSKTNLTLESQKKHVKK